MSGKLVSDADLPNVVHIVRLLGSPGVPWVLGGRAAVERGDARIAVGDVFRERCPMPP